MTLKPLAGLRVLDFTTLPPGGACTVMLADLGAEIIRVESPALKGKASLVIGQVALSRAKRSMTLDMRNPASSEILLRLAATVDIVVENAKPGAMESRGFGYAQARTQNPGMIWCAITGFGQTGPYAEHAGHDISYTAHSGLLGAISAEQPWHPGTMLAVPIGAQSAVIAIQAALLRRAQTGEGAFLDISLSEAAGWMLTCAINPLSDKPYFIPASHDRRLYRCADDRFVAVASAEPRTWQALCEGLGAPELKERLHDTALAEETAQTLEAIFATRSAHEWVERLAPRGAAVTLVNRGSELLDDPQVQARGSAVECGGKWMPASPIRIESPSGERTTTEISAPHMVGDDTFDILQSTGFSGAEIDALAGANLI